MRAVFSAQPQLYYILKHQGLHTQELRQGYSLALQKKLRADILVNKKQDFLISGEELSELTLSEVKQFKTFLDPYFDQFKVLSYVRHPYHYVSSIAQQMIKSGGTINQIIEDTFERNIKENVLIQDKTKA